eukprot:209047-Amphidinium_carterae.1
MGLMAWQNPHAVAQLIDSFKALGTFSVLGNRRGGTLPAGRRGSTALGQQPVQKGSKKSSAQTRTGWNWLHCKYYNFGFRSACFLCKIGQEGRPTDQETHPQTFGRLGAPTGQGNRYRDPGPFDPAAVEFMKYVKERTLGGDPYATTILQNCVGEFEESSESTHSGEDSFKSALARKTTKMFP